MNIDLLSTESYAGGHPHAQYDWLRDIDHIRRRADRLNAYAWPKGMSWN